jgi:hypothetical protein
VDPGASPKVTAEPEMMCAGPAQFVQHLLPVRVGGAFSETRQHQRMTCTVREEAALKAAFGVSARTWKRHIRVPLLDIA